MSEKIEWKPLDTHVIVVAAEGGAGEWAAYIGAVPGKKHADEWQEVLRHGTKLSRELAEFLFPVFKEHHRTPFYRE